MFHTTRSAVVPAVLALLALAGSACTPVPNASVPAPVVTAGPQETSPDIDRRLAKYTVVQLVADTTALTPNERRMLPLLIDAAREMDAIYWDQAYGSRDSLLGTVQDPRVRRFIDINYGPWDRLDNDVPFVRGISAKPPGANLYPNAISKVEFDAAVASASPARADSLKGLYTLIRRAVSGGLAAVPYRLAFRQHNEAAAAKLRSAAALAQDAGLKRYLELRAYALLSDDYRPSDLAWMDMKNNTIDVVIGPIETYEDQLFGYKAANEAYVLIKDRAWSERLSKYIALLPALQRGLPVAAAYKAETPGSGSDLNAYDAVFYAGQANAGAKTIAINLPNDEQVQLTRGTRRLQLKNAMRAKFDKILVPIAQEIIVPDQLPLIRFDAFFENTMFHEVAHGLGIKNTLNGSGTVRAALKERASALEEGKADILGLYMVQKLSTEGQLPGEDVRGNYVDFLASLFRSVRFGGADAHGRANIATFNFLEQQGAFARDSATGKYRVDFARMQAGTNALAERVLMLQGNGDYAGVGSFQQRYGTISPTLQRDLDRLRTNGIPVDVVFEQGMGSVANAPVP